MSISILESPVLLHLVGSYNFIIFLQLLKFPKIRDRHLQTPAGICTCTSILLLHLPAVAVLPLLIVKRLREGYQLLFLRLDLEGTEYQTCDRYQAAGLGQLYPAYSIQLAVCNHSHRICLSCPSDFWAKWWWSQGLSRSCSFRGDCGIPTLWYATARAWGMCRIQLVTQCLHESCSLSSGSDFWR